MRARRWVAAAGGLPLCLIVVAVLFPPLAPSACLPAGVPVSVPTSGTLTPSELEGLWIAAGGPPAVAATEAAVADAESGGIPDNVQKGQPYATTGWGLWQITPGDSEPQFGVDQQLLDPVRNAEAAVAKYRAGGLSQWTTYTSGAYLRFMPSTAGVTPSSYTPTGPVAVSAPAGVVDPLPGWRLSRDDMGVDGSAPPGTAIVAPAASVLSEIVPGWYNGQPLLLFRFVQVPAGASSAYWYVAEQVTPATTAIGAVFQQGQPVGTFAPSGTGIEIGWGSARSTQRTLAGERGDSAAANPPSGATTVWGESFRSFFGLGGGTRVSVSVAGGCVSA